MAIVSQCTPVSSALRRLLRTDKKLSFEYSVQQHHVRELYVIDAIPCSSPDTQRHKLARGQGPYIHGCLFELVSDLDLPYPYDQARQTFGMRGLMCFSSRRIARQTAGTDPAVTESQERSGVSMLWCICTAVFCFVDWTVWTVLWLFTSRSIEIRSIKGSFAKSAKRLISVELSSPRVGELEYSVVLRHYSVVIDDHCQNTLNKPLVCKSLYFCSELAGSIAKKSVSAW